jgi:hypothetical protein
MKTLTTSTLVLLVALTAALPSFGKDKKKKVTDQSEQWEKIGAATPVPSEPAGRTQPAYTITFQEKRLIRDYCQSTAVTTPRGRTAHKLPPGLAKRIDRGDLPPGWQKKICVGQVIPEPVLQECAPLPREITVRLPKPPLGTITVAVEGRIVRLMETTHEILDVFELAKNM